MRRFVCSWLVWLAGAVLAIAQPAEKVVDDPDTYWDERLMPIIAPIIEQSKTWAPVKDIDWSEIKLGPEEALPRKASLDVSPERLRTLFEQLDLSRPGLETVHELYQAGDLNAAAYALVEYYRAKDWPAVLTSPEPATADDYILVELAMIDIFTQGQVFGRQPRQDNGLLDWEDGGPRDDPEWAWWINRMGYLARAASLWEATGNPRYPTFASEQLIDWVRANPYPGGRTFSAQWRPLEVARRIDTSWLEVFIRMKDSPELTPEARLLLLSSVPDHADALLNHPSFSGNHLLTEKVMLAQLAVAFPEFKQSGAWLKDAVETVVGLLKKQVYPDGAYIELTNHYQWVALGSFQRFLALLESSGAEELTARVRPTVEKMWDYFAYVMRPSGYGPLNNDSDLIDNRKVLADALEWFDRPDWEYLASGGERGKEPEGRPTKYFPWAGQAIMRSGWDKDAQWAFFDIGPYGSDHQHNDRLHLSVSFGGKDFLVDSGRYDYSPGPARDYHTGPLGHNTIMLDGHAPLHGPDKVSEPMNTINVLTPDSDVFEADVHFSTDTLQGKAFKKVQREVFYQHGVGWIVTDEIIAFGPTKVEVRWLFHPDRIVEQGDEGLRTVDPEGANIRLAVDKWHDLDWDVKLYRGQEAPFQAGWYSDSFTTRQPATQAIFITYITKPTKFVWHVLPTDTDPTKLKKNK